MEMQCKIDFCLNPNWNLSGRNSLKQVNWNQGPTNDWPNQLIIFLLKKRTKNKTVLVPRDDLFLPFLCGLLCARLRHIPIPKSINHLLFITLEPLLTSRNYLLIPSIFHFNQKEEATGTDRHWKKMPQYTLDNSFRFDSRQETVTNFLSESIEKY